MSEPSSFTITPGVGITLAGAFIAFAIIIAPQEKGNTMVRETPPDQESPQQQVTDSLPTTQVSVPTLDTDEHVMGNKKAPIMIVEYSDLECPFCYQLHPTLERIVDDYKGKVMWSYRHFPLDSIHAEARIKAETSECVADLAGNEAFWAYINMLFQGKPITDYTTLGVSENDVQACLKDENIATRVNEDQERAIAIGGQGTPYTVISDGKTAFAISGALPYEAFKAVIDTF